MEDLIFRVAQNEEELRKCFEIREDIFFEEQKIFEGSDTDDHDSEAIHIVAIQGKEIVGTVRIYPEGKGTWFGGRLAVLQAHRGGVVGKRLVRKAVELVKEKGAKKFYAYVQEKNVRFFKRLGWRSVREVQKYGLSHQLMEMPV
jgi:putative N-acetyltransferase (TIGR04045 family)